MQKLKSGNWRERITIGKDADGRQIRKSFTAPTKREVLQKIDEWKLNQAAIKGYKNDPTVRVMIDDYINAKSGVLSPSTIARYRKSQRLYYDPINNMRLSEIKSKDIQLFISSLKGKDGKPLIASARSVYTLLTSAIRMYDPERRFNVSLPVYMPKPYKTPMDAQIKELLNICEGELRLAVMLSAFGTLRRGEVCALKYADIDRENNTIQVRADMVKDEYNVWIYKDYPKTSESVRLVIYPAEIIREIPEGQPDDFVFTINPEQLYGRYMRKAKKVGIESTYHGLRHYAASFMHALGIPDKYIMAQGGWKSDSVLKSVYENPLADKRVEFAERTNEYVVSKFF